jgi:hypothetical protein
LQQVPITEVFAVDGGTASSRFAGWSDVLGTESRSLCSKVVGTAVEFEVPANTAFLEVWAPSGIDMSFSANVLIKPSPQGGLGEYLASLYSPWETEPQIMFFTRLDPTVSYTLQVANRYPAYACVHKVVVYSGVG